MPRFDMPGRDGRLVVVLHESYKEYRFDRWPYQTEDPVEIDLLTRAGAEEIARPPKPQPKPEPPAKPEPSKEV